MKVWSNTNKHWHPSRKIRERKRAERAEVYREGFNDGYKLGYEQAKKELK
jgi:hypothetical protein